MRDQRKTRKGLRIKGQRGHPVVRRALIRYAKWLRTQYEFPIRVPVYLSPKKMLTTIDGLEASATFFAPWDREVEPYIRIATGDYSYIRATRNRDDTLASYIASLSHEIVHYQQWIRTGDTWERGAIQKARKLLNEYAKTVDHP